MRAITIPVVFGLVSASACGAADGGGDDTTSRLTEAAYERACTQAEEFLLDQYGGNYWVQALCTAYAVENNTDAAACGDDLNACLNDPPPEIQAGIDSLLAQAGCSALTIDPATCTSTVGRLTACLDGLEEELTRLEYTLTCAAAGETLSGWDLVDYPDACYDLDFDC